MVFIKNNVVAHGDPARDCQTLAEIVRRGRQGGPPFDLALLAFGALLEDPDALTYDRRSALYAAARDAGLPSWPPSVPKYTFSNLRFRVLLSNPTIAIGPSTTTSAPFATSAL